MINLNTNLSSLITQRSLAKSTLRLNQAIEQMTTGFKINHAKDNAANYNITTNMTTKIGAYMVAEDNCAMGLDLLATANGSLDQIADKLQRLRALAVQTSNGTYGTQSKEAINSEVNALIDEIDRVYKTSEHGGRKLFDIPQPSIEVQIDPALLAEPNRVSKQSTFTAGETYYLADSADVVALQDLVNSGVDTTNVTFEVLADIDMEGVEFQGIGTDSNPFKGKFDGKNHSVYNLKISTANSNVGFWGRADNATISNLSLENVDISGASKVGAIVGHARTCKIDNCYASGRVNAENDYAGGIVGWCRDYGTVSNTFSNVDVYGTQKCGGISGAISDGVRVENCISTGEVYGERSIGGIVGYMDGLLIEKCYSKSDIYNETSSTPVGGIVGQADTSSGNVYIRKSYYDGNVKLGTAGAILGDYFGYDFNITTSDTAYNTNSGASARYFVTADSFTEAEIEAKYTPDYMGFTEANGWEVVDGELQKGWVLDNQVAREAALKAVEEAAKEAVRNRTVTFQIGTKSEENSRIDLQIGLLLEGLEDLRSIGLDNLDYLTQIDSMLNICSERATQFGAAQNRLESALDEISVQYENLVSSRSTLRDADISEVSSEYIRQQILQQASATLMATANQSPSIALQLI